MLILRPLVCVAVAVAVAFPAPPPSANAYQGWPAFGGGPGNIHYSSLKQINKANVARLAPGFEPRRRL